MLWIEVSSLKKQNNKHYYDKKIYEQAAEKELQALKKWAKQTKNWRRRSSTSCETLSARRH